MDDSKRRSEPREIRSDEHVAGKLVSDPVCTILETAVRQSGRTRREIGIRSKVHKDALRRILAGERSPTIAEAITILEASGLSTRAGLVLCLVGQYGQGREWLGEPVDELVLSV